MGYVKHSYAKESNIGIRETSLYSLNPSHELKKKAVILETVCRMKLRHQLYYQKATTCDRKHRQQMTEIYCFVDDYLKTYPALARWRRSPYSSPRFFGLG